MIKVSSYNMQMPVINNRAQEKEMSFKARFNPEQVKEFVMNEPNRSNLIYKILDKLDRYKPGKNAEIIRSSEKIDGDYRYSVMVDGKEEFGKFYTGMNPIRDRFDTLISYWSDKLENLTWGEYTPADVLSRFGK